MIKRFSIFCLIFCMVVSLTACTETEDTSVVESVDSPVQESHESKVNITDLVEIPSIDIESGAADGISKAETETTSYEFHGRTEEENLKLAQINEIAYLVLKHEYGYSPPKGRIVHFIGEKGIRVSEFSVNVQKTVASNGRTVINPDLIDSVGALFYGSSRNRLPAWLSVGLEVYWSDRFGIERFAVDKEFDVNEWQNAWQAEMADIPAFGDFWFRFEKYDEPLYVAFGFVKWLDENGLLDEIVRAYLDDKQTEGDLLFADAWQKFTGYDIRGDFFFENRLRYFYGNYIQTDNIWDCYTFSVLTEHGYYFLDSWWWRNNLYEDMIEFINNIDIQYIYAKQWLGVEDSAPIPTRIPFNRPGVSATGGPNYVSLPGGNLLAAVHEAFHYLLFSNNIRANFAWLTEGLPEAINFMYADEGPDFYGRAFYYAITGKTDFDGTYDFKHHAHLMALEAANYFTENDRYGSYLPHGTQLGVRPNDKPSSFPQGFLNTYSTAASFVIYMLEIGSKEDFMKLYVNTSVAEELYGKDFNALYEQWLEFINQI